MSACVRACMFVRKKESLFVGVCKRGGRKVLIEHNGTGRIDGLLVTRPRTMHKHSYPVRTGPPPRLRSEIYGASKSQTHGGKQIAV